MNDWEPARQGGFRRTRVAQNRRASRRFREGRRIVTLPLVLKLREPLGLPECPYVIRWRLETKWFSVRLHHWLKPDDDRAFHDHPWSFTTFVLKGGYVDKNPDGEQHLKAFTIQHRDAHHKHTVVPDEGGCWTIIFTGPKIRNWGFWVKGKFIKMNKYFLTYGHHPCD